MKLTTDIQDLRFKLRLGQSLPEYRAIRSYYGARCAERSGVPLINHIHEGMVIIAAMDQKLPDGYSFQDVSAMAGYCLHPLFQSDADLVDSGRRWVNVALHAQAGPVMLAMEYRWRANNWLSDKVCETAYGLGTIGEPDAGHLSEVRAMLIADKVQNYKDFLAHHAGTHPRAAELDLYFRTWLENLGVDDATFGRLVEIVRKVTPC